MLIASWASRLSGRLGSRVNLLGPEEQERKIGLLQMLNTSVALPYIVVYGLSYTIEEKPCANSTGKQHREPVESSSNDQLGCVSPGGVVILGPAVIRAQSDVAVLTEEQVDHKDGPAPLQVGPGCTRDVTLLAGWHLRAYIEPGAVVAHPELPGRKLHVGFLRSKGRQMHAVIWGNKLSEFYTIIGSFDLVKLEKQYHKCKYLGHLVS